VKRRWVVAAVAAVGVALILLGTYWFLAESAWRTPSNGFGPGPGFVTFGSPRETNSPTENLYNFTVQADGGGLVWNDLSFEVMTPTGATVATSGAGWGITVFDGHAVPIATYDLESVRPAWTSGGTLAPSSVDSVLLVSPLSSPLSGDYLVSSGLGGGSQGTVTIAIP